MGLGVASVIRLALQESVTVRVSIEVRVTVSVTVVGARVDADRDHAQLAGCRQGNGTGSWSGFQTGEGTERVQHDGIPRECPDRVGVSVGTGRLDGL